MVYLHCDVSLPNGPALVSYLPAEGAGITEAWKVASLEQGRVWWGTVLWGVSRLCEIAIRETWRCSTVVDV